MAMTVIGSLFGATLGTNLIYLWLNSCLARKVAYAANRRQSQACFWLAHSKAVQILRDMKAVDLVKEQFTLADVLPSNLECSEHSSCSHHSRVQNQQQSVLPRPNNDRTIVVEDDNEIFDLNAEKIAQERH